MNIKNKKKSIENIKKPIKKVKNKIINNIVMIAVNLVVYIDLFKLIQLQILYYYKNKLLNNGLCLCELCVLKIKYKLFRC